MLPLLLLKLETAADAASPEARYLLSYVVAQARRVWPRVDLARVAPGAPVPAVDGRDVLLLGPGNVLVTARSLAAMAERRQAGAMAVVPVALQSVLGEGDEPIYSLRGFERVEARCLAAPPPAPSPTSLLPISLLAEELVSQLGHPTVDAIPLPPEGVAVAGVYHPFVDYYGEVRDDILPFVPAGVRDVLEIGCGGGATGRMLQDRLGVRVTGVELNPAVAAAAAAHLHRVLCGDVTELELDGSYDLVVALELFEHLTAGEAVLCRLAERLRPGGRIVLSVPNVGHHSVVSDLLAGRWDYLPIGLLCYTHYRFFTRKTLEDWMARLGFHRFELIPQRTELPAALANLPDLEVDRESLATKGFYVLIDR